MTPERLQKVLAKAGFGSRRACEELIAKGRVRVNGAPAELGQRVDLDSDAVTVDGVAVSASGQEHVYLALHKPVGVVTTAKDPDHRQTVLDLVPTHPRLFPVGRLDRDSSGLLLMTNDGDFALKVAHPRYEVPKVYVAEVAGNLHRKHLSALRKGIELDDGLAKAESIKVLGSTQSRAALEVTVREGRTRLVRRMFDAIGLPVESLVRTRIGPVQLGRLKRGGYRALTHAEVAELLGSLES